jgi:hypothetical protein
MATLGPYGDGSSGVLNVTSGTTNLALNTKHQFSDVTIAAGATLSTNSTTGSVLYILCNGTFTLDGTINLQGRVQAGMFSSTVTIDGTAYSTPGIGQGGYGGYGDYWRNNNIAYGGNGAGGGGAGAGNFVVTGSNFQGGGNGGAGGYSPTGGDGPWISQAGGQQDAAGGAGTNSGGGGGSSSVYGLNGATSISDAGNGGASHGANGGDGAGSLSGSGNYGWVASGGGGAGGAPGKAGVHLVIKAKTLILNGSIITAGTAGGNGGYGGQTVTQHGPHGTFGGAGGGGGGGNGGKILLTYSNSFTTIATLDRGGGAGGQPGAIRGAPSLVAVAGTSGTTGAYSATRYLANNGSFLGFF